MNWIQKIIHWCKTIKCDDCNEVVPSKETQEIWDVRRCRACTKRYWARQRQAQEQSLFDQEVENQRRILLARKKAEEDLEKTGYR